MFNLLTTVLSAVVSIVSPMPASPQFVYIAEAKTNSLANSVLAVEKVPDIANDEKEDKNATEAIMERKNGVVMSDEDRSGTPYNELGQEIATKVVLGLIQQHFKQDWRIMAKVASCESELQEKAKNKNSTAKGIFQILDSTWKHFNCEGDVLNAEDNIKCGKKILDGQGLGGGWSESFSCWKNL